MTSLPAQRRPGTTAAPAEIDPAAPSAVRAPESGRAQGLRDPWDALPSPESPRRRLAIRTLAVAALGVTVAYLSWRAVATLPAGGWWLAVPFLLLEVHAAVGFALFVSSTWDVNPPEVPAVPAPAPSVTVLVPTYNEDLEVLLPTVAAAVDLDGPHETWVLDDGNRPEVAQMATALGARHVTRPVHDHAKAGNLNHALRYVQSDLVAVFDADHVPDRDFLTRTIGYFTDPRVAIVQTPQDFYNVDSFEHLDDHLHEESLFYRVLQAGKHSAGAAFWCGTNAVLRVDALRAVGGVATESLTEDLHTTMRLHRAGWSTVYHNEVLARGLAAGGPDAFLAQRLRWGQGAMHVLRHDNPLRGPGLTLRQRVAYLYSLSAWFDSWRTLLLALVPVVVLVTGVVPVQASPLAFLLCAGTSLLLQQLALVALGRGRTRLLSSLVFDLVRLQANLRATRSLLLPERSGFRVTAKGRTGDHRARAGVPRVLQALGTVLVVAMVWGLLSVDGLTPTTYPHRWVAWVSLGWLVATLALLAAAVCRIRDLRYGVERRDGHRFPVRLTGRLGSDPAVVEDISLGGALVRVGSGQDRRVGDTVRLTVVVAGDGVSGAAPVHLTATVRHRHEDVYRLQFHDEQWRALGTLSSVAFRRTILRGGRPAAQPAAERATQAASQAGEELAAARD
jgi:cellulose synthase/poly-beta-1,6-N-acetylglucosamine synthase-like glycosyltransferase